MQSSNLVPGKRYLLRLRGKQFPVEFESKPYPKDRLLIFHFVGEHPSPFRDPRITADGDISLRSASGVSRHYDDCYLLTRENGCRCAERLAKEGK